MAKELLKWWSIRSQYVFVIALFIVAVAVCDAGETFASFRNSLVAGGNIGGGSSDLPANLVSLPSNIIPTVQTFTNDIYISSPYSSRQMLKIRNSDNIVKSNEVLSISGIGSDPNSNDIYFGDVPYLKKISGVDGTISIIAGITNDNITAKFIKNGDIKGMAFDGDDLYYTDSGQLVIRKIDGKTDVSATLIADTGTNVIRKVAKDRAVSILAGPVSVFAGVWGRGGYNGDNIAATDAFLTWPNYVIPSSNQENETFITENSRIRKIFSNGTIITIAGSNEVGFNSSTTLAVDAQVNQPNCIFFNGSDLYFCDTNNYRLRKIDENGYISTVAGNGQEYSSSADGSTLANETSIGGILAGVIDPLSGDIYIASYYVIYRIFAESGKIITLAGKEGKEFNGEDLPLNEKTFTHIYSLLIKDNMLYVSHANMISVISLSKDSNQIVETITGSSGDGGLAIDRPINPIFSPIKVTTIGDIYVNEKSRIRKISKQTNVITTILGSGATGVDCSSELDVLATRTCVQVIDFDVDEKTGIVFYIEGSIVKMIDNQGYVRLVAGSNTGFSGDNGPAINATFSNPKSILAISNSLLIADTENNRIRKIDLKSNIISTIVGNGNADYTPGENITEISINSPRYFASSRNNEIYYTIQLQGSSVINKLTPYCPEKYILDELNCLPTCFGSRNGCLFGNCTDADTCECQSGYYGSKCDIFYCSLISFNSSNVCSGKGSCLSPNNCSCNSGYYGLNCELFDCFGISSKDSSVCSGSGTCLGYNSCECQSPYYGNNCELFNCSDISYNSPSVCSSNGSCLSPNNCSCNSGYYGLNCELFDCFGISNLKISSCSGKGLCLAFNSCSCLAGYSGKQCEISPKISQSTKVSTSFKLSHANTLTSHPLFAISIFLLFSILTQ